MPRARGFVARVVSAPADAVRSFHPRSMSLLSRRSYALELVSTLFFALALASVEGGIISVFVKQTYRDLVPKDLLVFMVALLGAAPELANILSFVWTTQSHGKPKVPMINGLQIVTIALIALVALTPLTPLPAEWELIALGVLAVISRVCWSGIITLRPTLWRANYPPAERARMVGKFSTVQVLVVAAMGLVLGKLLDMNPSMFSVVVPVCCALGSIAVVATARQRLRGEPRLLREEIESGPAMKPWQGPAAVVRTLKKDRRWAQFMAAMFLLGIGNLMLPPVLVVMMADEFRLGYLGSMLINVVIPLTLMPLFIPLWARLLDRSHVVRFRAIHSWVFVSATLVMTLAALLDQQWMLYLGAVLLGAGYGGGSLAWNLGHMDFAPPAQTSHYMATHITLNGVRGILGPFVAATMYALLSAAGLDASFWVLALCTLLCLLGAIGFVWLRREMDADVQRLKLQGRGTR